MKTVLWKIKKDSRMLLEKYFANAKSWRQPLWLGTIIWYVFGMGARVLFLMLPALEILEEIKKANSETSLYSFFVSVIVYLLFIAIGSRLVFTTFIKPNSRNVLVPDERTRTSIWETSRMGVDYNFALTGCFVLLEIKRVLLNSQDTSYLREWYFPLDLFLATIWVWIHYPDLKRLVRRERRDLISLADLDQLGNISRKFRENLSEPEQKELGDLLFQTGQLSNSTAQSLFSTIWYSIIIAGILEVIREIGVRLLASILG